jgi:hypothetical protein
MYVLGLLSIGGADAPSGAGMRITSTSSNDILTVGCVSQSVQTLNFVVDNGSLSGPIFQPSVTGNSLMGTPAFYFDEGWATNWTNVSDIRSKENIKPETRGLDYVSKLKPVTYTYKQSLDTTTRHSGFIYQDVEGLDSSFGGLSKAKADGDMNGLRYYELLAPIVNALIELKTHVGL